MSRVTRRKFLARSTAVGAAIGLSGFGGYHVGAAEPLVKAMPNTKKLGWRVGFSAYSFRTVTLFEALDKMAATGLHYAETFAWRPEHLPVATAEWERLISLPLFPDMREEESDHVIHVIQDLCARHAV